MTSIRNYDNPWQVPRSRKSKWAKDLALRPEGKLMFFAGCSTSLLSPDKATKIVKILRALGAEPAYLGQSEKCCGSIARKIGDVPLARAKAEACLKDFVSAGAETVVTSCPGCASALNHFDDLTERYAVRVLHISQFLDGPVGDAEVKKVSVGGAAAYHDPCDLGRALGVYEEPRRVLSRILSDPVVEMERSRSESSCCGSGGGVRSAFPELADAVSIDRLKMASAVGARALVTSCPWCIQSLSECRKGDGDVEVVDLIDLVYDALVKD